MSAWVSATGATSAGGLLERAEEAGQVGLLAS